MPLVVLNLSKSEVYDDLMSVLGPKGLTSDSSIESFVPYILIPYSPSFIFVGVKPV